MQLVPVGSTFALVDDEDFEFLSQFTWYCVSKVNTAYATSPLDHRRSEGTTYMHNLITGCGQVDHADGNGLNNQRSNLRPATKSQNGANRLKSTEGRFGKPTSQYKGVYWETSSSRWRSSIRYNRKLLSLGRFTSEEEAARVYDSKSRELFGEFAALNFPENGERGCT